MTLSAVAASPARSATGGFYGVSQVVHRSVLSRWLKVFPESLEMLCEFRAEQPPVFGVCRHGAADAGQSADGPNLALST